VITGLASAGLLHAEEFSIFCSGSCMRVGKEIVTTLLYTVLQKHLMVFEMT
jgi:hypothetical protein